MIDTQGQWTKGLISGKRTKHVIGRLNDEYIGRRAIRPRDVIGNKKLLKKVSKENEEYRCHGTTAGQNIKHHKMCEVSRKSAGYYRPAGTCELSSKVIG